MLLPESVKIVEVGPRDGLQNESQAIPLQTKISFVERLASAGLKMIETGSFVNPRWVQQMADSDEVFKGIERKRGFTYSALVPNLKGFERAMAVNATEVAIFASASEAFSRKNINCSIYESLERFQPILAAAKSKEVQVRGYISCVLGCPYEGEVAPEKVADITGRLFDMGCYEVSLADTIGVGTPASVDAMFDAVQKTSELSQLAVHMHDTYGQAIANIYAALLRGVAVIDASVAGLGGCPYAKGASGNVATEDVVYLLEGLGIKHGIDMRRLVDAGNFISRALGRTNGSRAATALSK